jgi:hypothetical protein
MTCTTKTVCYHKGVNTVHSYECRPFPGLTVLCLSSINLESEHRVDLWVHRRDLCIMRGRRPLSVSVRGCSTRTVGYSCEVYSLLWHVTYCLWHLCHCLEQWYSTWGTLIPGVLQDIVGGTLKHLTGYVIVFLGSKVRRVRRADRLTTI